MSEIDLPRIITIDGGPSTGKTSVSTLLADRLGYQKLTTGMFLCSLGAAVKHESLQYADLATLASFIAETDTRYDLSQP